MSTRRSLSTFGASLAARRGAAAPAWRAASVSTFGACLGAALLLAPAAASAQTADSIPATERPAANLSVGLLRATTYGDRYDRIQIRWANSNFVPPPAQGPLTGFRIFYKELQPADTPATAMPGEDGDLLAYKYQNCPVGTSADRSISGAPGARGNWCDLTGLKPNQHHGIRVAPYNAFGVGSAEAAVVGVWTRATPIPNRVTGKGPASYLCTTAGTCVETMPGDELLRVKWEALAAPVVTPGDAASIASYNVRYRTSQTTAAAAGGWVTMSGFKQTSAIVANLTNGRMYDVEVAAVNKAGLSGPWSITVRATPMMPTPALPLVGALALGAALAAAARHRLRRRQLRG